MPKKGENGTKAQKERDAILTKAYGKATTALREAHKDEFNSLYTAAAAELGIEWHPRLTPEQKAEQEFDRLLEAYPHLAERLTPAEVAPGEGG